MHKDQTPSERRSERRVRQSGTIEWRYHLADKARTALLLEASDTGFAFAWRGTDAPRPNTLIEFRQSGEFADPQWAVARVRRHSIAHADLTVIAVERWGQFPDENSELAAYVMGDQPSEVTSRAA